MAPPLLLAAKNGSVDASTILLKFGADIRSTDCVGKILYIYIIIYALLQKGNTALHMAVLMSHKELVELFCYKGAPVDKQNKVSNVLINWILNVCLASPLIIIVFCLVVFIGWKCSPSPCCNA